MDGSLEAQPARAWHAWLDRLLISRGRGNEIRAFVEIAAGLALCFGLSWSLGGGKLVSSAWYLPMILIAAGRFRYAGAITTAIAATALAGPVLHLATGSTERPSLWVGRGVVFLLVGLVTASLIEQLVAGKEREVRLAEQERDLAVRQAAVIATVSHEFRTPLTVITGVAHTLETQGMVSAQGSPLLEGLTRATRRLTDLVNAVGAVMDDPNSGAFVRNETVVIRDVLTRVLLTLGVRDPKNRVSFEVEPEAELFKSDTELISQLLRHIVENAVKFSPLDQPVQVHLARNEGRLGIVVQDHGPGLDESVIRSAEPFLQGDSTMTRTHQGLGLGLFAAKRLATALDGSIAFERCEGGGTRVTIEIAAPDL